MVISVWIQNAIVQNAKDNYKSSFDLCFTFKKFNLKNFTFKKQLYEYSHAYLNEPLF